MSLNVLMKELTSFVDTLEKCMTVSVFLWPKVLEYIRQKITTYRLDNNLEWGVGRGLDGLEKCVSQCVKSPIAIIYFKRALTTI